MAENISKKYLDEKIEGVLQAVNFGFEQNKSEHEKDSKEHQRLEEVKNDLKLFRNEVLVGQDKILTIVQRLDQDKIFTNEAIKRLKDTAKSQQIEINKN